jgi:phage I-like protein
MTQAENGPQFVAVLGEIGAEGLVRIPLAKLGRWFKGKLQFSITRADVSTIVANFRKRAADVVIDYDHGTEYAAGSGQPVPASGWLKEIEPETDGSGILWGLAEFTAKAREMLRAKEYKYVSSVINWGARDKTSGEQQGATITSVALTNVPVLEQMPAIALSEAGWVVEESTERREAMVKKLILADRAACTARAILEDGTETVLSVEGLTPEVQPKVIQLSDVKRATDGRFDFAALSESEHSIAPEVFRAMTVQQELDAAVKEGKITPAERPAIEVLALNDLPKFREFVAGRKKQIDLSETGLSGGAGEGADLVKIDAQIDQKAREKMAADKGLDYNQALRIALNENPGLRRARTEAMRD